MTDFSRLKQQLQSVSIILKTPTQYARTKTSISLWAKTHNIELLMQSKWWIRELHFNSIGAGKGNDFQNTLLLSVYLPYILTALKVLLFTNRTAYNQNVILFLLMWGIQKNTQKNDNTLIHVCVYSVWLMCKDASKTRILRNMKIYLLSNFTTLSTHTPQILISFCIW